MNVFIDIETIPSQAEGEWASIANNIKAPSAMKKQETIDAWHNGEGKYAGQKDAAIDAEYRKQSFDATKGELVSAAFSTGGDVNGVFRYISESEEDLLEAAFSDIRQQLDRGRPPFFIGHNVRFDLGFLWRRAVILGVNPGFELPFSGRHGNQFFCTMEAWAGFGQRISQDKLCKALGLSLKPDGIDGSKVWDYIKEGKSNEVFDYNKSDVEAVEAIYNRITFKTSAKLKAA